MRRTQELYCHNCDGYVKFPIDLAKNGNHVLNCPNCNHEHCRVVKDGIITDIRWDQRNGPTHRVFITSYSTTATITATSYTFVTNNMTYTTSGTGGGSYS
jgi:hypothetical protein